MLFRSLCTANVIEVSESKLEYTVPDGNNIRIHNRLRPTDRQKDTFSIGQDVKR